MTINTATVCQCTCLPQMFFQFLRESEWIATHLRAGTSSFVFVWVFLGGKCAACLCMWTQVTPSVCVCSWLCFVSVLCVCVCVSGIKPYLFTELVCLANTSWLPCSWQTDRQPQFVYCFRTVEIVGTWKRFWLACVWFMHSVCLISIINDNTAEGRKTHLLSKRCALMSRLKRTML